MLKIGIVGLGTIGQVLARALDAGIDGLTLAAVSVRDPAKAEPLIAGLTSAVPCLSIEALVEAVDVVVDCAVAASLPAIARPALLAGRILVTLNSGALLGRPDLFDLAQHTGGRLVVPSGGIIGFDGLRALAEAGFDRVLLVSRKPPESLAGAPHVVTQGFDLSNLAEPMLVFSGSAANAAIGFPANANVAATLSMATLGPDRTEMEIWADPAIDCLYQEIQVTSPAASFRIEVRSHKMPDNPRTGTLTPLSALAALRGLVPGNRIGG
jgi:aspartate dehydrogenase